MSYLAFVKRLIYERGDGMNRLQISNWYEQYKNGIFRYALSITKDAHLAEDVLHDTFVKVMSAGKQCADGRSRHGCTELPAICAMTDCAMPSMSKRSAQHLLRWRQSLST